jgi:hypothetical protein
VFSEKTVSGKTIALESGKKFFPEILEEEEEANMNEEQLQIMSRSWSQQTPPAAVEEEDLARSVQLQAPTRILSV